MDYSGICYKKTCLSQVIMRVDFRDFIESAILSEYFIESEILNIFPRKGMQQVVRFQTMNFKVDSLGTKAERESKDGVQREYKDINGNKIFISNKYIVLEINSYTKYEEEIGKIIPVLKNIMSNIQLVSERTGIRYINKFGSNGIKPQKSFFSSPASAFADNKILKSEEISPIRAMALNEYLVDDMHLNFRYGQYNAFYPHPLRQNDFVLDYDCYCEDSLNGVESIIEHFNKGHDAIQDLFEKTITDKLRKVMLDG